MTTISFEANDMILRSQWVAGKAINLPKALQVWLAAIPDHPSWGRHHACIREVQGWIGAAASGTGKWESWAKLLHEKHFEALHSSEGLSVAGWRAQQDVRMALAWLEPITEREMEAIDGSVI